jgi:hypothetical protein
MPHVLRHRPHVTLLNTDGRRHPLENSLAITAFVIGMMALVLGVIVRTHMFGAIAGLIGFPLALSSQLVSETIGERWLNIVGLIAATVGLGLSLAHGGFTP